MSDEEAWADYYREMLWKALPGALVLLVLASLFVGYVVATFVGWLARG